MCACMCERARASWWAWEEQQTQLSHTLALVHRITKAIRRRRLLRAREKASQRDDAERMRDAERKKREKHELIIESLARAEKWKLQDARETAAARGRRGTRSAAAAASAKTISIARAEGAEEASATRVGQCRPSTTSERSAPRSKLAIT